MIYTIYPTDYLWNGAWMGVTVAMTQDSWTVWVNGGVIATVSGQASMPANWDWIFFGGATTTATGNTGAPPTADTITGIPCAAWSHLAIYPGVLPAARVMAHFLAAYSAFGQLPAPTVTCQFFGNAAGGPTYYPDGNAYLNIPFFNLIGAGSTYDPDQADRSILACYVTSTAGNLTSAVSQPESVNLFSISEGAAEGEAWLSATGLAPSYSWWVGQHRGRRAAAQVGHPALHLLHVLRPGRRPGSARGSLRARGHGAAAHRAAAVVRWRDDTATVHRPR